MWGGGGECIGGVCVCGGWWRKQRRRRNKGFEVKGVGEFVVRAMAFGIKRSQCPALPAHASACSCPYPGRGPGAVEPRCLEQSSLQKKQNAKRRKTGPGWHSVIASRGRGGWTRYKLKCLLCAVCSALIHCKNGQHELKSSGNKSECHAFPTCIFKFTRL